MMAQEDHSYQPATGSLAQAPQSRSAGPPRFKVPAPEDLEAEQLAVRDELLRGSRGGIDGIANILLRSPKVAAGMRALGGYIFSSQSGLKPQYVELAILIQARAWSADYEWWAHVPKAIKSGISKSAIDDIKSKRKPKDLQDDEEIVFDLLSQLVERHEVDDTTYDRAVKLLGERGLVDLVAGCGQYGIISMLLKVSRTQIPAGPVDRLETLE
jgi:4-carboxymuconolactone decarboxylase